MKDLRGKTAIVTGAGSGIGHSLAIQLAERGVNIAATDINEVALKELESRLKRSGVRVRTWKVDHTKLPEVENFHREFTEDFITVDLLCSNAGAGLGATVEKMTLQDWEWMIDLNIKNSVYMVHLFVPGMIRRKTGHILITASVAGLIGIPAMSAYCMSKYAMVGLSEALRAELKLHNIGVTALCPGVINTNIIRGGKMVFENEEAAKNIEEFYEKYGASPDEVATDAIKAIEQDIGIMPTPLNTAALWWAKRIAAEGTTNLLALLWQNGLLRAFTGEK